MALWELLLLAVGLSMDAFAVAAADGLCCKNLSRRWTAGIGLCFGLMQGIMPLLGYALGSMFLDIIAAFDHYIALILLGFIGVRMLIEAWRQDPEQSETHMTLRLLLVQGVATAIDALAVGVSFAALGSFSIVSGAVIIACVTFALSVIGVLLGKKYGTKLGRKAQILGGLLLIGIGVKIFVTHMFF